LTLQNSLKSVGSWGCAPDPIYKTHIRSNVTHSKIEIQNNSVAESGEAACILLCILN